MSENVFQLKDKNLIYIPFHEYTDGIEAIANLNHFHLDRKKTYCNISSEIVKICNIIINENPDLLVNYLNVKFELRLNPQMELNDFIELLYCNIIDHAEETVSNIVERDYKMNLDEEIEFKKIKNSSLIYRDVHCKLLLKVSYMMKFTIPMVMEYAYHVITNKDNSNDLILAVYDRLFSYFQKDLDYYVNLDNKLSESVKSRIVVTKFPDMPMWNFLINIGININNFIYSVVKKLKTDIVPKYDIDRSVVNLTLAAASHSVAQLFKTNFPVSYKTFDMTAKSEEEEVNKFERIEINSAKINEDLNILHKIIIQDTIRTLYKQYNIRLSKEEIAFYFKHLRINKLQTNLIGLFFAKHLGSCEIIYKCSRRDYIILLLIMKKILLQQGCKYIPAILTGYVTNTIREKKVVSKKYLIKVIEDERYKKIIDFNYRCSQKKIEDQSIIKKIISTLISTNFCDLDYYAYKRQQETNFNENNEIVVNEFELIDEIIKLLEMI